MVLQPFSIPEHIGKIKSGEKTQTTRKGLRDLQVGTKLQQYYRPRMKKGTCVNCIHNCYWRGRADYHYIDDKCPEWTNFFGEVPVEHIRQYPFGLQELHEIEFEGWAISDGFTDGKEADEWFTEQYGIGWKSIPMTVIKWDNSLRVMK
jgi:hypothetical protein